MQSCQSAGSLTGASLRRRLAAFGFAVAAAVALALVPGSARAQQAVAAPSGTPGTTSYAPAVPDGGVAGGVFETGLGPDPFYSLKDDGADFVKASVTTRAFG